MFYRLLLIFLITSFSVSAKEIVGTVVGVSDGDTITVLTSDKKRVKVRLAEIDAPEKKQPFGGKAKQVLSDMCFNIQVKVDVIDKDRYGRTVGRLYCKSVDVNAEMVKHGLAWSYTQYNTDPLFPRLEKEARAKKIGMWSENPIPPWEWRKGSRKRKKTEKQKEKSFSCGEKRYCKHMSSCEEARYYLNKCGMKRLDRDKDGIPCESIC